MTFSFHKRSVTARYFWHLIILTSGVKSVYTRLFKPGDTTHEDYSQVFFYRNNFTVRKGMFPAKATLKLAVLLTLAVVHADGYFSCCEGLCYKQCNNTNCLCTNHVKCTTNDECASMDTCSTPCSLPENHCPDTPLKCYGTHCWKQCGDGNSWCITNADVMCLRDSQCSSFECASECISLNPYDCINPQSTAGIAFRCNQGFCYRQCQHGSKWCTRFNSCEGNGACDPFDQCQTTCAAL
jgi:hypothetical protein